MELNKTNPEDLDGLFRALAILNKEIMRAIQEGKGFMIGGVIEGAGNFSPTIVGMSGGKNEALQKIKDVFSANNYNLLMAINEMNEKIGQKKTDHVEVSTIQKDDGSIIINFNK